MKKILDELNTVVEHEWSKIKQSECWRFAVNEGVTKDLYRTIMEQIYHYTRYNSINQAQAAGLVQPEHRSLLRFVYKHAAEELGHEMMVVHDLKAVGLWNKSIPAPLPSTAALIGYLSYVAQDYGAVPRLGYSYWAEQCYMHLDPLLKSFRTSLNISDKEMSFFVSHSEIDSKHADEVNKVIGSYDFSESEAEKIIEVAKTTLYLTGKLLDDAYEDCKLRVGLEGIAA